MFVFMFVSLWNINKLLIVVSIFDIHSTRHVLFLSFLMQKNFSLDVMLLLVQIFNIVKCSTVLYP